MEIFGLKFNEMLLVVLSQVVSGVVIDADSREPVPYAAVEIDGRGVYADEKGFFTIRLPKEGRYTLRVSALGYKDYRREIDVKGTVRLKVFLKPGVIELKEAIVTARREAFRREFSINVQQDISRYRLLPSPFEKDLMRIIQIQPGVVFTNDFSGRFSVRGSAPFENLTILDGMYLYNPYHLGSFVSIFDVDAINRFMFLKGGYTARYGNATGSIIHAELREGKYDRTVFTTVISPITTKVMFEGPINDRSSFLFNVRRSYISEVLSLLNVDFPYYFYDITGKITYNFSDISMGSFSFINSQDNFSFENMIDVGWGNKGFSIIYKTFYKQFLYRTYLSYTANNINMDFLRGAFSIDNLFTIYSMRNIFDYIGEMWSSTFGLDFAVISGYYRSNLMGISQYTEGTPMLVSLFFELKREWKKFTMNGGVRGNYYRLRSNRFHKDHWSIEPRMNFKYFLTEEVAFKLSAGLYYQYAIAISNPQVQIASFYYWVSPYGRIDPVSNIHIIAGIEGIPSFGNFDINVFFKPYLFTATVNMYPEIVDIEESILLPAEALSYGLDLWYQNDWLDFSYTLTFSYNRAENEEYWKRAEWDRRHTLNISIKRQLWGGSSGIKVTYATGNPYTDILARYLYISPGPFGYADFKVWTNIMSDRNAMTMPDYKRVDFYYEKKISCVGIGRLCARISSGVLGFGIINVLNNKNLFLRFYDYRSNPPIRREIYQIPFTPYFQVRFSF